MKFQDNFLCSFLTSSFRGQKLFKLNEPGKANSSSGDLVCSRTNSEAPGSVNLDELSGSDFKFPPRKCSPVFHLQREKNIIQKRNDDSVEFNSDETNISEENFSDGDENFLAISQLPLPKSQEKTEIKKPVIKNNVKKFMTSIEMKDSLGTAFQILLI